MSPDLLGKPYLEGLFRAAVAAVEPGALVEHVLFRSASGLSLERGGDSSVLGWGDIRRILIVGGGKAARSMGGATFRILDGRVESGILAVPGGSGGGTGPVRSIEAGHPLPDEGSRRAAGEMISLLSGARDGDLVIALISGGGSAMVSAPAEGITPADKEAVLFQLLRNGVSIADFNAVRKHLSLVKGGRMAKAASPARVWALLLSDVPGDDPSVIASGPFSPDPTTYSDARRILEERGIWTDIPRSVRMHIESGAGGMFPDTPKPGDPVFAKVTSAVIGSNRIALEAARMAAESGGAASARILPGFLQGEARECACAFVSELRAMAAGLPEGRSGILAAGGETTVTVRGRGRGGRNQEFALSAAIELDGEEGIALLSAGTDGVDGATDAAGAYVRGDTCSRARVAGLDPGRHLSENDSHSLFRFLSDLVTTGPTGTNVTDVAIGAVIGTRRT